MYLHLDPSRSPGPGGLQVTGAAWGQFTELKQRAGEQKHPTLPGGKTAYWSGCTPRVASLAWHLGSCTHSLSRLLAPSA
jgi:hypothetical protein